MGFFEENWFWRGTQSAIFYYISCAPYAEWKYKRRRKNEATRAKKEREEIIATQPGIVQQPAAFQTNEDWVEEILMGPGPPKGWKRDAVANKLVSNNEKHSQAGSDNDSNIIPRLTQTQSKGDRMDESRHPAGIAAGSSASGCSHQAADIEEGIHHSVRTSDASDTLRRHSDHPLDSSSDLSDSVSHHRPSLDRRFSTAMDNLRDTIRSTIRPEAWNWMRYERDDEILSGFNQRMTDMWNKATTSLGIADKTSDDSLHEMADQRGHQKPSTKSQSRFDYQKYARNPEINELHPPVVSRLPATRDQAAWMILPPPSAAVMEGKVRPQEEKTMRWPLARIGRTHEDWAALQTAPTSAKTRSGSGQTESMPELSDSFTEPATSSDEETWKQAARRNSTHRKHSDSYPEPNWDHPIVGAPKRDPARPWLAKLGFVPGSL